MNQAEPKSRQLTVMVTGSTGFVGFHTVLALVDAGHDVRLLVRSPEKMKRVFEPMGLSGLPCIEGDITNQASVEQALDGCDAVVHAAAMVNVHARDSDRVLENNLQGTRFVLGGAAERGIDRMIQVSSTTALFRPGATQIDESSPMGNAPSGYGRSKIECDKLVRTYQDDGVPIYTTYPGTVLGPYDPGMSEGMLGLKLMLDAGMLMETTSGMQMIDVRDLALAHVALLESGGPPDRYLMGGQYFEWHAYGDLLASVVGRPIPRITMPQAIYQFLGGVGEFVDHYVPLGMPLTRESTRYATEWVETNDRHIKETIGLEYRNIGKTLYDAIFWLQGAGHLRRTYQLVAQ